MSPGEIEYKKLGTKNLAGKRRLILMRWAQTRRPTSSPARIVTVVKTYIKTNPLEDSSL